MKKSDSKSKLMKELQQIANRNNQLDADRKHLVPVLVLLASKLDVLTDKDMKILKTAFAKLSFISNYQQNQ